VIRSTVQLLAAAFVLAACASPQAPIETASSVKSLDDPFRPYREYSTSKIQGGNPLGPGIGIGINEKQLAARVDRKTGAVATFLEFEVAYTGALRRSYERATNVQAEMLPVTALAHHASDCNRQTGTCSHFELLHIAIPESGQRSAGADGFPIKIFARTGPDIEVAVPKELIVALLAKVDADRMALSAAPASGAAVNAAQR
jgi:hypothetical protein